ncbi:MAG: amidinotransferase [Chloroflexi bacterium]|nr:amidinotransferase [Chloroflexota bacterium]
MDKFLMCPPDYFGIEYEINPWMRLSNQADLTLARKQWQELYRVLTTELGASVELLKPVKGLPDLVFTANAGYVQGDPVSSTGQALFVSSSFKHKERQGETPFFDAWFQSHGYQVRKLGPDCIFEGAGDALPLGETIFAGYRHRSEICSHQELGDITGRRVLSLELADPRFYHLDTCFCPLDDKTALYFPPAFDTYARKVLSESVPDLVAVSEPSAHRFACNAVVLPGNVVTNTGCADLAKPLAERGYNLRMVELSEFMKSGGSAKCLTLRL